MKTLKKIFHIESSFKSVEEEDGSLKISGYASTNDVDRVGDVIVPDAWNKNGGLDNFQKNPIILFNHDYDRPVGRATSIKVDERGLKLEVKISKAAQDIIQLVKDGVLSAFSVGFRVKDAKYDSDHDIYYITEAELYETSIVSVPCNQDAVFSLAKSFDSAEDKREFFKQIIDPAEQHAEDSVNAQDSAGEMAKDVDTSITKEIEMTPEELKAMAESVARETAAAIAKSQADAAAAAAKQKEVDTKETDRINAIVTSGAEKLMADIESRFKEKNESLETIVNELKEELKSRSSEIEKMRESKRNFTDRTGGSDWRKEFKEEVVDTYILGLASGKGWNTKRTTGLLEKVNSHSGVEVSSEDFEQIVSTNIERDIENSLILAPLFREMPMTSATMILPIMPDAGYAQFADGGTYATRNGKQTAPHGNLDERGVAVATGDGIALGERVISTKKLISTSFLGNETEEDAILPILPLIREAMVRSHARAIENALLLGNHAQGAFGTAGASFDGLVTLAAADGHIATPAGVYAGTDVITAADLFQLRKGMGKYGVRPEDVVYIVSQDAYYNLIEDAEFQDANLVTASVATKLKGSIGSVYGSQIIMCDEYAAKGAHMFHAMAVYTRNYAIPRLRGLKIESEYSVQEQRRVLVASQRLGFVDIIDGAATKFARRYKAVS